MILLPKYGLKRLQRGLICATAAYGDSAGAGSVFMTNEIVNKTNIDSICWAGIRFNTDGSIDAQGVSISTFAQVNAGEWWTDEPDTNIGASYDVRALSTSKTGTWSTSAAADDTWIQISADRGWGVSVLTKAAPDTKLAIATFEIRVTGSGSALDSAVYTCQANN